MMKKLLLKAARMVAELEETYSCTATSRAEGYHEGNFELSPLRRWYSVIFAPLPEVRTLCTWDISSVYLPSNKQRDFRVLLLCFAAASYEDLKGENL